MKREYSPDEHLECFLWGLVIVIVIVVFCFVVKGHNIQIEKQKQQIQTIYDNGKKSAETGIDILANPYSKEQHPQEHIIWFSGYTDAKN
jgi:hypothetical protein